MSRNWALGPTVALVVLAGCGADQVSPRSQSPATFSTAYFEEETSPERRRCREEIPFEPTYLPSGFEHQPIRGPAPGGRSPDQKEQVILHFKGSHGRAIEIRRPGTLFTELAQSDDAPTIDVLGAETSGFAPIQPGGDDFIVQFTFPSSASPEDDCALFSLNEVGVSLAELKKVAEGLREPE